MSSVGGLRKTHFARIFVMSSEWTRLRQQDILRRWIGGYGHGKRWHRSFGGGRVNNRRVGVLDSETALLDGTIIAHAVLTQRSWEKKRTSEDFGGT